MHLLPCPHCDAKLSVAPSQAGDNMPCPECGQSVAIPSLGQIRQLPQAEQEASSTQSSGSATQSDVSAIRRAGFLLFGLIAIGSLMIAAYSGIRWYLIDVPATTEEHIAMIREEYAEAPAAQLIREFEDMERYGLELATPYRYKVIENERNDWGQNASIAGAIGGVAVLGAVLMAGIGRRRSGG